MRIRNLLMKPTLDLMQRLDEGNRDKFWEFVDIAVRVIEDETQASVQGITITVAGWKRVHPKENRNHVWISDGRIGTNLALSADTVESIIADFAGEAVKAFEQNRTKDFDMSSAERDDQTEVGPEKDWVQ